MPYRKECLIITGGEFCDLPADLALPDYVIACDLGWRHVERMGIVPDLVIGDFDSAPMPESDVLVETFPSKKDDTDTMLAVKRTLKMGYRDMTICCVFGGRLDHTIANIQTASYIVSHGGKARLIGTDTEMVAFTSDKVVVPRHEGWSLSVFALSDLCAGVSIKGAEYECENISLENKYPLGVSNAWASDMAEISVKEGILLVVMSKML